MNSLKQHIFDITLSRLEHDLPVSVNGRVILPNARVLFSRNLEHAKFPENKTLTRIS